MRNQHPQFEISTSPVPDKIDFVTLRVPAPRLLIRPRHVKLEFNKRRAPLGLLDAGDVIRLDLASRELFAEESLRMLGDVCNRPGVELSEEFVHLVVASKDNVLPERGIVLVVIARLEGRLYWQIKGMCEPLTVA